MTVNVPTTAIGRARLGMIVADTIAEKDEDDQHDQKQGQQQGHFHVVRRNS